MFKFDSIIRAAIFCFFTLIFASSSFAQRTETSNQRLEKFVLTQPTSSENCSAAPECSGTRTTESPDSSSLITTYCVPGQIEAENYYSMVGVGTEACSEGGLNVGSVQTGDSVTYHVNVLESGTYLVEYRVASATGGQITLKKGNIVLGQVAVPVTGQWQDWATVSHQVNLPAGIQDLTLFVSQGAYNINWLRFSKFNQNQNIPGTIQAAEYSNASGVITEPSQDGGGLSVGTFSTNDWVEYNVNIDSTGSYFVEFRVAADVGFGGKFAVQIDGNTVETLDIKNPTLGWYNWKNVGAFIDLPQGQHTLRITATESYNGPANDTINLHWMKFSKRKTAWSDDFYFSSKGFNVSGKPVTSRWNYDIHTPGWVNNELQNYTDRVENAHVENGLLTIEAKQDWFAGYQYSSARIKTKGSWINGRMEIRAKLPGGNGAWPAIWLLAANESGYGSYGGWPAIGEIDIMEHVGFEPNTTHGSAHNQTNYAGTALTASFPVDCETNFHTYAVEWFEDRVDYFVDDVKYFTVYNAYTGWQAWPYDKPFYLILNVAVGGTWGGQQGIDNSAFPMKMEVDYVRVYQKGSTNSATQRCPLQPAEPWPGPQVDVSVK